MSCVIFQYSSHYNQISPVDPTSFRWYHCSPIVISEIERFLGIVLPFHSLSSYSTPHRYCMRTHMKRCVGVTLNGNVSIQKEMLANHTHERNMAQYIRGADSIRPCLDQVCVWRLFWKTLKIE